MPINELAETNAKNKLKQQNYKSAITILMKAYGEEIFSMCYAWIGNREDADDLLQNTFIKAFRALESFKGDSSFRTWLYKIARNNFLDSKKMISRLKKHIDESKEPDDIFMATASNDSHIDFSSKRKLDQCLNELSSSTKHVLLLKLKSEFNYREISNILNEKAVTLQARVARALPVLKLCLEKHGVTL